MITRCGIVALVALLGVSSVHAATRAECLAGCEAGYNLCKKGVNDEEPTKPSRPTEPVDDCNPLPVRPVRSDYATDDAYLRALEEYNRQLSAHLSCKTTYDLLLIEYLEDMDNYNNVELPNYYDALEAWLYTYEHNMEICDSSYNSCKNGCPAE